MKKILLQIIPALLLVCLSAYGQNRGNLDIPINISLIKGINLTAIKGDLDFGEIVLNHASTKMVKTPNDGLLIEVNGNPGRNVFVDYSNSPLFKQGEESNEEGSLDFNPNLLASETSTTNNTTLLNSNSSLTLKNSNGLGKHYLWIGGEIDVDANSSHGSYQGTLTLTVSY
jgi:spore coat protein U-like protein